MKIIIKQIKYHKTVNGVLNSIYCKVCYVWKINIRSFYYVLAN